MAPKRKSSKVTSVVGALTGSEALPEDLKALLGKVLPVVLDTYKADRHEFETEIVDKAAESLGVVEKALAAEHEAALAKQLEVVSPAERAKRDGAKDDAGAKQQAATDLVETCSTTKKAADKSVEDAEAAVKVALKAEKDADKIASKTGAVKSSLTTALNSDFVALVEGTFAKPSAKKAAVSSIVKLGKEHGVGNTLGEAFVLACGSSERSPFEATTFDTVKAKLAAALETVSKQVEEEVAVVESKKAETAAAKDALAKAEEAQKDADEKLAAAKEALKEAKKIFSSAVAFRKKVWTDMKGACETQDELASFLRHFKEVILPVFEELKEKAAPPVVEEAPAEVEEPPEKKQRTEAEPASAEANAD
jgi:hypothetical protein